MNTCPVLPSPPSNPDGRGRAASRLRPGWIGLGVAMVAVGVLLGTAVRKASRDRPLMELLDRMGEGTGDERRQARQELVSRHSAAAPVLVAVVRGAKTRWQSEVMPWFEAVPGVGGLRSRSQARERHAIEALQRMGPGVAPSVVVLLDEARNGGRESAIALLRTYGPGVVPLLQEQLVRGGVERRIGAAMALGRFRVAEQGGLGALFQARRDQDARVRSAAVWALGEMQDSGADVVPELVASLADASVEVQGQAVQALRGFEAGAAPAVEGLRRLLREGTDALRVEAALTLSVIGDAARVARDDLRRLTEVDGIDVRRSAAAALVQLQEHPETGLSVLRELLGSPGVNTRARTAEMVAGLGSRAEGLVPDLLRLLENADPGDDRPGVVALRQIAPESVPERFRRGRSGR
ncbi:MAG: HEAT repeat domain-containing protein [Verrucomicrobiales bacterium]|nr:HEAT repeat domain-containing protein [Verrucomicrobiales bacterium]